jgi:hypothetical protein
MNIRVRVMRMVVHLKLALSTHTPASLTTQRVAGPSTWLEIDEHGSARPARSMKPLSRANCSRHIGRNKVKDTITNTSLEYIIA